MAEPLPAELSFTLAQYSTAGVKAENEDAIGIRIPEPALLNNKGAVAVIADGVSAAEAGKEASETCVHNFLSDYFATPHDWDVKKSSSQVLTALNRWLFSQGRHYHDAQQGYVSTFSAIIFKAQSAHIFHVGDSRIYRLRNDHLQQVTQDHTTHINRELSCLSRAMGLDVKLDVDYRRLDITKGDIFLLSSDGLHDFVKDSDLHQHLSSLNGKTPQSAFNQACTDLIQLAQDNNSDDNLSCQILRIDEVAPAGTTEMTTTAKQAHIYSQMAAGVILDGYQVIKRLHYSHRSQSYLVMDLETQQTYCMKTPPVNFEKNQKSSDRFNLESWIGSRVNNPNVIKVVAPSKARSSLYYLTEYVDGMTLAQWIKENPAAPIRDVLYLVQQIVKGLTAMHRREILHQDIHPGNIMIDKNGEVKIIDFGSCHVKSIGEIPPPFMRDGQSTRTDYTAPEVVLGGHSTLQSEVFSIAVIVYEMLTGRKPFGGQLNECRTDKAYLNTRYTACFEQNPLVPIWMDGAVKKGLRFKPERRYEELAEFLHELQHPNPKYKRDHQGVLMDKDPLLFWQLCCATLFMALCISLFY